jgi:cation diffusion facilitator CzcD-associated flavoprotein CzcO
MKETRVEGRSAARGPVSRRTASAVDGGEVDHTVIIIGAGFGGIGVAISLKKAGIENFVVLDKDAGPGGTWRDNVYPGVACDVPAVLYEYPFEPNPDWSQMFAPGCDIQSYAERCIEKYEITPHLRLSTEVESLRFDEGRDCWRVNTSAGQLTARFVFVATGVLTIPTQPDLPGLDAFEGWSCHTARWSHAGEVAGRRVGIVGTGASAMQLIPELAREAASLVVVQRTPIWVLPRFNPTFPRWARAVFRRIPITRAVLRFVTFVGFDLFAWLVIVKPVASPLMARLGRWHLRRQVPDRDLRARLTPHYGYGCKRPSFSNEYFATFTRPNVELVTSGIDAVTPTGIRTSDGQHYELDALVMATGFKVYQYDTVLPFAISGIDGVDLASHWAANRYQAYEGISVPPFPNLFLVPGPYAIPPSSYFEMITANTRHALRCITEAANRDATRVAVRATANDAYLADVLQRHRRGVYLGPTCVGSGTYYFDPRGDIPFVRPQVSSAALRRSHKFSLEDYEFSRVSTSTAAAPSSSRPSSTSR